MKTNIRTMKTNIRTIKKLTNIRTKKTYSPIDDDERKDKKTTNRFDNIMSSSGKAK